MDSQRRVDLHNTVDARLVKFLRKRRENGMWTALHYDRAVGFHEVKHHDCADDDSRYCVELLTSDQAFAVFKQCGANDFLAARRVRERIAATLPEMFYDSAPDPPQGGAPVSRYNPHAHKKKARRDRPGAVESDDGGRASPQRNASVESGVASRSHFDADPSF